MTTGIETFSVFTEQNNNKTILFCEIDKKLEIGVFDASEDIIK